MWGWSKYVPVAKRQANAKREMDKLRKKGKKIQPVEIQGRNIAKNFWGKRWCEHLETFSDFENRLPRGRTYVRNGSICHLGIKEGAVEAFVSGSSLYKVEVTIATLEEARWQAVKAKCSGQVGSLLELLSGQLSDNVMEAVANPEEGLFPNEEEIDFSCDCPDWANMCKHVAAVLYGIGSRLDERPELLFLLRGVDTRELITTKLTTTSEKTDDLLHTEEISELFDIDIEDQSHDEEKDLAPQADWESPSNGEITGEHLQNLRKRMNLTVAEFAHALGVTPTDVDQWEENSNP